MQWAWKKPSITCENLQQCIIVLPTQSHVVIKAIFKKNIIFNIAVSWKRKPHTTPSNDWWQIHVCMCSNCTLRACNNGWTFWIAGAKLLHANRGQLPPPRSIWVIPGSRGVLGIEEVGVGPLKSDFLFTEFSNRGLRVSIRRIEEFKT